MRLAARANVRRIPKSGKEKLEWNRVVVVLENATLETVKVGR